MSRSRLKTIPPPAATSRRAGVTRGEDWEKKLLASHRVVERVRRDFEATRVLCRQQREMIAEQRKLLRDLEHSYAFAFCERTATSEAEAARQLGEDADAGE
jgi:hypothetical protein